MADLPLLLGGCDTCAYWRGNADRKHKMAPVLSPKKPSRELSAVLWEQQHLWCDLCDGHSWTNRMEYAVMHGSRCTDLYGRERSCCICVEIRASRITASWDPGA